MILTIAVCQGSKVLAYESASTLTQFGTVMNKLMSKQTVDLDYIHVQGEMNFGFVIQDGTWTHVPWISPLYRKNLVLETDPATPSWKIQVKWNSRAPVSELIPLLVKYGVAFPEGAMHPYLLDRQKKLYRVEGKFVNTAEEHTVRDRLERALDAQILPTLPKYNG